MNIDHFQVGVTDDGLLNGVIVTYYADCGSNPNDNSLQGIFVWADNGTNTSLIFAYSAIYFKCIIFIFEYGNYLLKKSFFGSFGIWGKDAVNDMSEDNRLLVVVTCLLE